MYAKGFPSFLVLVMIIVSSGCDNVEFGGFQVELRPPAPAVAPLVEVVEADTAGVPVVPLDLEPILYLLERGDGSAATLTAVAQFTEEGYIPLPDPDETPDFLTRFSAGRLDPGTEFDVLARGMRVGTFLADGTVGLDESTCLIRPSAGGLLELRPELEGEQHFLALVRSDAPVGDSLGSSRAAPTPVAPGNAALGAASVTAAQIVLQEMNIPWPASIPQARMDLQPLLTGAEGPMGLAATFVYGGTLGIGPVPAVAYGLFIVADLGATRPEPIVAWYQRSGADGKAFPRLLGAQDLYATGRPDLLLEVFGTDTRSLAVLGARDDDWSMLYEDPCGAPAARGGVRSFR
ncbi:MAG: hypothetical protein WD056_01440 [Gemmatimonadota bacterium]